MASIKLGCDPEFFLKDRKTGAFVSAHDKVPGTKTNPHRLPGGGYVQADGTAVEFNIPPSASAKEWVGNIRAALSDIRKEFFAKDDLAFAFEPVAEFAPDYFKSLPLDARALGCEPDYNAYTDGGVTPKPNANVTFRTGSGHIHVGYLSGDDMVQVDPTKDDKHMQDCCALSIVLDNSLLVYKGMWDQDRKRSTLYGKPGCFRPKAYGLEYRSLSNAWLNYPALWPWLFSNTKDSVLAMMDGSASRIFQYLQSGPQYLSELLNIVQSAAQCKDPSHYISSANGKLLIEGYTSVPSKKLGRVFQV